MRSILQNKFDEFLEILQYDKTQWHEFWEKYRSRYGPIIPSYERLHGLDREKIKKLLEGFSRPFLDRLKQEWEKMRFEGKRRVAFRLRERADELELSNEDFVVFLFGGLGIATFSVVDGIKEKVVLIDLVKVWKDGRLNKLDDVVLESVKRFRKGEAYGS